jgi:hypothetical protein
MIFCNIEYSNINCLLKPIRMLKLAMAQLGLEPNI